MYPEIFGLSFLHTYGVLVAVAFLSALWLAARLSRQAGVGGGGGAAPGAFCARAGGGGGGVLGAVPFRSALVLPARLSRQAVLDADAVTTLGIYCALAAIGGAKLMMFLIDIPYYTRSEEHTSELQSRQYL